MSPFPITAISQIKPKVDDSATVAHWNRLSTEDSTTSASDVVSLGAVNTPLAALTSPASPMTDCCSCSVPIDELNAIFEISPTHDLESLLKDTRT
ncbi:Uncharacterized protein APZ42_002343 [Daphnia magna]|uniref:Uncharacterized protein n=1 Tax=Daphnia magna TaxID=35525 RepID=A0A164IBM9_9CRUS|nr:Uncharacterized protein APZ42_002343 [Daphnia magna]